ncbi:MAG TPA: carboxypeptidase regulatory-like domain-containing protein [Terriglobales bacterium]
MKLRLMHLAAWCALFALFCAAAAAQNLTNGAVTGTITDPSGAVVANANVTLKNRSTGAVQSTHTNSTGLYTFPFVQPGEYSVAVSASGFQPVSRAVTVALNSSATANVQVALSSEQQTIEVTGSTATVETEDANVDTVFDARQVSLLPNPGNDLSAVALSSPGVVMNTTGGATFGGGNYEFYGLPSNSNVFTYDGANANDPYFQINNTGATNLTLGLNDVQETSVVTNGYSGQYGGLAGADINYISKSGSNAFHGNAIWWWNGRTLNANNYFLNQQGAQRPFVNANQYAGSIGGPIKKDKAFFFFDYEGIRLLIPAPLPVNVPTQAFENAVIANLNTNGQGVQVPFYNAMFGAYNNAPGSRGAQNVLPNGGCDDVSKLAGISFGSSNPCALNYTGATSALTHDYLVVGRYDQNIGNNDKLFVRVQHEAGLQATYIDPLTSAFNAHSSQPEWQGQFSETHTFGNNKVNNFVASQQWYSAQFTMVSQSAANAISPFTVLINDGALFPINNLGSFFPQGRNVTQYGITDDFSWVRGNHDFKVGVNFRRDDVSDHNFGLITPLVVPLSLGDFANGTAGFAEQNFAKNTNVPIALYQLGWYISDEWKASQNLKLTLSMRFDHLSNPICRINCFTRLSAPFSQLNTAAPVNQAIQTGVHTAFPSVTSVVYQPKIGFAWSPFGARNTVIRGGAGIFSDAIPSLAIDQVLDNAPNDPQFSTGGFALSPAAGVNSDIGQLAAANTSFVNNFASGAAVPAFNFFNGGAVRVPRYYEWDLEVQQAVGWHSTISAKYVGNHGSYEELTNPALNAFAPSITNSSGQQVQLFPFGNLPATAPDPRFGVVAQTQNIGNSNYNGLVLSATHSFTGGFQFQAGYTYSHSLDDISNNSLNPFGLNNQTNVDIVFPIDQNNIRKYNYGNSDYDVRHSFNMNYVWSDALRHITSKGPNALVKGWTFSGTIFAHGGLPYSIFSSALTADLHNSQWGSSAAATGTSALAVITGNQNPDCGSSAAQIVNGVHNACYSAANFADPGVSTDFGNQRRNQYRGPNYVDTDFGVEKAFGIPKWESAQFSIGARFFNLFNHPNFAFPVTDINNPQFGQILKTVSQPTTIYGSGLGADASPRVIEIQAKISF